MQIIVLSSVILLLAVVQSIDACGCSNRGKRNYGKREVLGEDITFELRGARGDEKLVDGDQIFTTHDQLVFSGFRASIDSSRKWPGNTIPYRISGLAYSDRSRVRNALAKLTQATGGCVKFRENGGGSAYARVFSGGGCYSYVGRIGRRQDISLGRGCLSDSTIQHEFMHALGFYHEQSRPDRDNYVSVQWGNIHSSTCSNFDKCKGCKTTTPYDIKSIMQYQGNAFSCNRRPTMVDKKNPNNPIRRNTVITQYDIKKIRDYYNCGGTTVKPTKDKCRL